MSGRQDAHRYFNRELSWLEFNARVLEEGLDPDNPLLERLRFLAIVSSNFDEFFMVRVAAIKARLRAGDTGPDESGYDPGALLGAVSGRARDIIGKQYACLTQDLLPALAREGLTILRPADYDAATLRWLEDYFLGQVAPALTPLAVPVAPDAEARLEFPTTGNLRIHAAFLLRPDRLGPDRLGIIQVPSILGRFVRLPPGEGVRMALLDDLVMAFGHRLFSGYQVVEQTLFKVTRDADIGVDEDRDDDFIVAMEEVLVNRQNSWPVRLSISAESEELEAMIGAALGLEASDVYALEGPIDLRGFMELSDIKGFDRLRYPASQPRYPFVLSDDNTIWDEIRKHDVILHVPYDSFAPVVGFIESAASDPAVLAIKMTLYRTSGDSPIVKALTRAARAGKQVTAVVELKARFDEQRNMAWASSLEQAGAIVVYGAARLKVHAKASLVVRREEDGQVRRYVHLSTGNYNDKTARLYSDLSMFTANPTICSETGSFFNMITGLSALTELRHLSMAPFDLKRRIISMIERETERSSPESPGMIAAKMNSLCDRDIIDSLYRASNAGVRIMLNVRGICQLVPGVKGMSSSITVVSIVGRYLEHARVCYFRNGGAEELYLSSADWMPRNLEKRIELLFPLSGGDGYERVYDTLMSYFIDNQKARALNASGHWHRVRPTQGEPSFSAQEYFHDESARRIIRAAITNDDKMIQVRRQAP